MVAPIPSRWSGPLLSVLRIVTGGLLVLHGTMKVAGFPASDGKSAVALTSIFGIAGVLEVVGGALLVVGLFVRPVAFLLSGQMAVAYFYIHAPRGAYPMLNGGEAAAIFSFILLYMAAAGGGPWALQSSTSATRSHR